MENARRRRFVVYFSGKPFEGDRAKLMLKTGLSKGRVTQLLDEDEVFGELAAKNLALNLGLEADYFESDAGEPTTPRLTQLETLLLKHFAEYATDEQRFEAINAMQRDLTKVVPGRGVHNPAPAIPPKPEAKPTQTTSTGPGFKRAKSKHVSKQKAG